MTTVIRTVYGLMYQPEMSDPLNTSATLNFHNDQVAYSEQVREFTRKYAGKSRDEWKTEIAGEWEDEVD
jgi:ubiquitin-protein ligase